VNLGDLLAHGCQPHPQMPAAVFVYARDATPVLRADHPAEQARDIPSTNSNRMGSSGKYRQYVRFGLLNQPA